MPIEISIPKKDFFDERINKFIIVDPVVLKLEHSLLSIKKWESRWHVPFLHTQDKTEEMIRDYIYCMSLNKIEHIVVDTLSPSEIKKVVDYISDPMTATTVRDNVKEGQSRAPKEILTSEVIYYHMIKAGIPIDFQKWHFNQLMTLIRVFGAMDNKENNKMSKKEAAMRRNSLNASRRAKLHSKG